MNADIFEKAKELGKEIAVSEEYRRMQRAQADYEADADTQASVSRAEELSEEMEATPDEFIALKQIEELRVEVANLRAQIDASAALKELQEARDSFSSLMEEVNRVIGFVIDGEAAVAMHGGRADTQGYRQVH